MAFDYDPKEASTALDAGEYPASLASVTEKVSSKGNPMLEVIWKVYPKNGGEKSVWDYIVRPSTIWKLKLIAQAMGKRDEFDAARFNLESHIGTNLTLTLRVKEDATYGDKNEVDGYGPSTLGSARPAAAAAARPRVPAGGEPIQEEDIPF